MAEVSIELLDKAENIIFPDQEKPEFLVRQPIFSYATYFEAKPRCTLHS